MLRSSICTAGALLICSAAMAQGVDDARSLLRPITGNIKHREVVLDPTTGQLQRVPANTINNDGKATVYSNTCPTGYFIALNTTSQNGPGSTQPMSFGDWGMLPSTAAATSATCTTGNEDIYEITQFIFGYCTSDGVPIDMVFRFWDATPGSGLNACTTPMGGGTLETNGAPTVADITLLGLPRSSAASPAANCYAIQVTLGTPGFNLNGGTAGLRNLSLNGDRFHWSAQARTGTGGAGPVLAGNANFGSPCNFCLGTIWEVGGQTTNPGIGLGQSNIMALASFGGTTPASGDCFWFGGNPWAGGFMILNAHKPGVAASTFCDGTDGALASCPCTNPGNADTGCDNAQSTGGVGINLVAQNTSTNAATITGTGFSTMGNPTAILTRGTSIVSPVVFGDGLRCISPVVRLTATVGIGGTSTHAFTHGAMAGPGDFHYQIWYRNTPSTFCDPFAGYNWSNGTTVTW